MSAKANAARGKLNKGSSGRSGVSSVRRAQNIKTLKALERESKSYRKEFMRLARESEKYYSSLMLEPILDESMSTRGFKVKLSIRVRFSRKSREGGGTD